MSDAKNVSTGQTESGRGCLSRTAWDCIANGCDNGT